MAITVNGSIITQEGTDTSLGALSSISGVGFYTIGTVRIYVLSNHTFVINGTLSWNTELEVLQYTGIAARPIIVNGTLTLGSLITVNGYTRNTASTGMLLHKQIVNGWNSDSNVYVSAGGRLSLYNTTVQTLGTIQCAFGSFLTIRNAVLNYQRPTPAPFEEGRLKIAGSYDIDGLTMIGGAMVSIKQSATRVQFKNFKAFQSGATLIQEDNDLGQTVTQSWLTVEDYNGAVATGGLADISLFQGSLIRLYGYGSASELKTESNNWVTGRDNLVEIRRKVNVRASNLNGLISGGVVYIKSVDNGARQNATINGNVPVNYTTADDVYIASTVNGVLSTDLDVLCFVGGCRFWVLSYSYDWKDYRHNGGIQFNNTLHLLSYESIYASAPISFNGNGTLSAAIGALVDTSLTLTKTQAAALTTFATLDDLHAACKNWKCQAIQSNIEYLGPSVFLSTLSGDKLDLGALNLVIDGAATVPFKVNTASSVIDPLNPFTTAPNTVVIKGLNVVGGTKSVSLKTTGTVRAINGGAIGFLYQDATGINGIVTLTGLSSTTAAQSSVGIFDQTGALKKTFANASGSVSYIIPTAEIAVGRYVVRRPDVMEISGIFNADGVSSIPITYLKERVHYATESSPFISFDRASRTVTVTGSTHAYVVWSMWGRFISETAQLDMADAWTYDGQFLDIADWNINVTSGTLSGSYKTRGRITLSGAGNIGGDYIDVVGVHALISGLDPNGFGVNWSLSWIKRGVTPVDYRAVDNFKSGTGNTTRITLNTDSEYSIQVRAPGYRATGFQAGVIDTTTQTRVTLTNIAETDLYGRILWPLAQEYSNNLQFFNQNGNYFEYRSKSLTTEYIPFLSAYYALEMTYKSPTLAFVNLFEIQLNATKDGFVIDPNNSFTARISPAGTCSAIINADFSYTNGAKAYDRFVANGTNQYLLLPQPSSAISADTILSIRSGLALETSVQDVKVQTNKIPTLALEASVQAVKFVTDGLPTILPAIKVQTDKIPNLALQSSVDLIKVSVDSLPTAVALRNEVERTGGMLSKTALETTAQSVKTQTDKIPTLSIEATSQLIKTQTDKIPNLALEASVQLIKTQTDKVPTLALEATVQAIKVKTDATQTAPTAVQIRQEIEAAGNMLSKAALETTVQSIKTKTDGITAAPTAQAIQTQLESSTGLLAKAVKYAKSAKDNTT